MEKTKTPKWFRKLSRKFSEKFTNDVYFKPKRREYLREVAMEARDNFLKTLDKPLSTTTTYQQAQDRLWADKFADQMSRMVDLIDNVVPTNLKKWELVDTHFRLYKKQNGKFIVIRCNYKKGIPKKSYETHLLIPFGFPNKSKKTKVQMIRGAYKLNNFEQIDEGVFAQKYINFQKVVQTFRSKKKTIKFELSQRGKIIDNNWLRIIM